MRNILSFTLAPWISAIAGPLWAQSSDQRICAGNDRTPEYRIDACTRAITSGDLQRQGLANAYYNRGVEWSLLRDFDRAISDYSEAIQLNPQYAGAYKNRGSAWDEKGDHDRAIADLNDAIRINPRYVDAYIDRGVTLRNKREYDRAISDFSEAIRIDAQSALAYYNRGAVYHAMDDRTSAMNDYETALRIDPGHSGALKARQQLLEKMQ